MMAPGKGVMKKKVKLSHFIKSPMKLTISNFAKNEVKEIIIHNLNPQKVSRYDLIPDCIIEELPEIAPPI